MSVVSGGGSGGGCGVGWEGLGCFNVIVIFTITYINFVVVLVVGQYRSWDSCLFSNCFIAHAYNIY